MHGGFDNETPNIPTNSILKLDIVAHIKGNAALLAKLESSFANQKQSAQANSRINDTKDGTNADGSRAVTPPMQKFAKANIRMGKGEIEQKKGQAPQVVNFTGSEAKDKSAKNVDSLHQLFLNHLLRPKEWSASVDGQTFFAFRREHILALADEAQRVLE